MISLSSIRKHAGKVVCLGLHPMIIQSILDFDRISGNEPSIIGIVSTGKKAHKCFWGEREMLLPIWSSVSAIPESARSQVKWMLNVQSGRRALDSTRSFFEMFPEAYGGHIFAEHVPEAHAQSLVSELGGRYMIAGPSGVGLMIPGIIKLGAIGGVTLEQLMDARAYQPGNVAIVSTSGGMTNELIHAVIRAGSGVSFAMSIGGDRFPTTSLREVLTLAEKDTTTCAIVYFGELGGVDEYEIIDMVKRKTLTKPVYCYIAGTVDEVFTEPVQFGHAKALAQRPDESARAKRTALKEVGVHVGDTFDQFLSSLNMLPPVKQIEVKRTIGTRRASILSTRTIVSKHGLSSAVGTHGLKSAKPYALSHAVLAALLGHSVKDETAAFVERIFELLIDHGGQVSGAVTAMITARAGKDLTASLASGILTIGLRFGGAISEAARQWATIVEGKLEASTYVEENNRSRHLLSGIGHKVYRIGIPDPRVEELSAFARLLKHHPHLDAARTVESITTAKNGKLILNVDGVIAALMLDLLMEYEKYSYDACVELIETEFFNALFIIPRSVGFIAHIMEQKRHDEGLFRLPDDLLYTRENEID